MTKGGKKAFKNFFGLSPEMFTPCEAKFLGMNRLYDGIKQYRHCTQDPLNTERKREIRVNEIKAEIGDMVQIIPEYQKLRDELPQVPSVGDIVFFHGQKKRISQVYEGRFQLIDSDPLFSFHVMNKGGIEAPHTGGKGFAVPLLEKREDKELGSVWANRNIMQGYGGAVTFMLEFTAWDYTGV